MRRAASPPWQASATASVLDDSKLGHCAMPQETIRRPWGGIAMVYANWSLPTDTRCSSGTRTRLAPRRMSSSATVAAGLWLCARDA
jgi:hypothetical protein